MLVLFAVPAFVGVLVVCGFVASGLLLLAVLVVVVAVVVAVGFRARGFERRDLGPPMSEKP